MAQIKPRSDSFINRFNQALENWAQDHFPWLLRLHYWTAGELRQMDRKRFLITWWIMMTAAIAALILSLIK